MNYPYYIVPDVEAYKRLDPDSEEAGKLKRRIVANIGDLPSLRLILGIDPSEFGRFYPDMENNTPSTLDTIDAFLDKFGAKESPGGSYIPEDTDISEDTETQFEVSEKISQSKSENDFKTLVRQRRYREALMLIERQNLKNTEKSIYFAHQIRFLKKLIAIENYRNKTQG